MLLGGRQRDRPGVLPHRRLEIAPGIEDVAQTVVGVGRIAIFMRINPEELPERLAGPREIVPGKGAITQVVPGESIFALRTGSTGEVGIVFGCSDGMIALREGDFALPERAERRVFGADVHRGRLLQTAPGALQIAGFVGLQPAEIGDPLQGGAHVGGGGRRSLDRPVGGIVIVGIVVGGDQQSPRLVGPRREGITLRIAAQQVDCSVERPAA